AEVPELRSLFDELDPASRPESLRTDTIPAPVAPEPGAVPSIVDGPLHELEAHRVWGSDEPGSETDSGETHDFLGPQAESADESEARLDMSVGVVATVVVLIFVVLIFVAFCSANDRLPGAPENVPRKQTYSVTEPANVREAATTEGRRVRTLRPGTILVGTTADDALGRTWLRITDGENAGLYVWTGNLEVTGAAEGGGDPVP
ncbi:MAG TPA: SH3 domain-containing protein, partial [Allosphingosinicella sp.]|nr:SH3 domain-containing protein [Allosphingosinicella sp.]